jgi:hypothetical protein
MAPPSFSSFPPSFTSFPDLGPGPSTRTKHERGKDKVPHVNSIKSREKRKEGKRGRKGSSRDAHVTVDLSNDERVKAKEDAQFYDDGSTRPFYSDRKGDPLNIRYGGLHAGDVPKYRLVNRMCLYTVPRDV